MTHMWSPQSEQEHHWQSYSAYSRKHHVTETSWHHSIKKGSLWVLLGMNFMSCMSVKNRAASSSADWVITGRQSPTASTLLLLFLPLFLQLLLSLTHLLQLLLDGWTVALTRHTKCLKEKSTEKKCQHEIIITEVSTKFNPQSQIKRLQMEFFFFHTAWKGCKMISFHMM